MSNAPAPVPAGVTAAATPAVPPLANPAAMPSVWRLAWRQAWLDLRAGELRLLLLAVVLAVAALTAVGFFADRLQRGLARDAAQLLGGDLVVNSDQPLPPAYEAQARSAGLQLSRSASFPSMARADAAQGGNSKLAAVKAVSAGYPLRGSLSLRQQPEGPVDAAGRGPQPGQVLIDEGLGEALGVKVGQPLWLGEARLTVAALIVTEPDRGTGFLSFAPRVMLHEADLPATGLVQPASRISYRLAVVAAGADTGAVSRFGDWVQARIETEGRRGVRVESLASGRPEMRQTLDRATKFLNLVALLAAMLAAVAVAVAARDFAQRRLDDCAMLRVLGLSQRHIAWTYTLEFAALGLVGSLLGVACGLALHGVFVGLLSSLLPGSLPTPGVWPALLGAGVGMTLLLAFGLPPVLQLARVPPVRVIRREVGRIRAASLGVLAAGLAGFAGLLLVVASDLTLGAIAVLGFAAAVALFALAAWGAVRLLGRWVPEGGGVPRWLLLATRQVASRPGFAVLQVSSLAVGLMALALLVLLRTDLIDSWRQATPPQAPNRFVINIQPDQAQPVRDTLDAAGVQGYDWFPMVRGRLLSINGVSVTDTFARNETARRSVEREWNLSYAAQMPAHNRLVTGDWADTQAADGKPEGFSIEQGQAQQLGMKLGDVLRFDIAGQVIEVRLSSVRAVDWNSMRANFFGMFPAAQVPESWPQTYMAAYRSPALKGFDNQLAARFPNLTSIDVSATLAQVQAVLNQVIQAVEYLFVFTVAAGLVVLFATLSATREARSREMAVMRACGASAKLLGQVQGAELLGLGALAGALATCAALGVGWALAHFVFEFAWQPRLWLPVAGAAAGALLALGAGWWGLRELLRRPVMESLRRAGAL